MLLLSALTWCAVVGLEPAAWLPWAALGLAWPWLLWQLPGASAVRLVVFPSAVAFHMAASPPPSPLDLVSVLFLFIAYIGFALSRPPAPTVDFRPVPPRGELRGLVPVAFLGWSGGLMSLMLVVDGRPPWILAAAVFCAAHFGAWRRLAQVGRPVREPLITLAVGTALLLALPATRLWAGAAVAAAVAVALAVWTAGVHSVKTH
ncbi:MAG: hypothetical protein CVU59_05960 [Deltaproteobacteria bacterium HGW-Deltaproteobacteria-17]|nr:MAG: hypothetical protein CVU59_05960 [Deltaproteobacteria bacterium HGW-Deltaproteobacteria-17]